MKLPVYRIEIPAAGALCMMPKPSGERLEADVQALRQRGVERIVSLLTVEEVADAQLQNEGSVCNAAGIQFDAFPIPDWGVPDKEPFAELVGSIAASLQSGAGVAVHCRAGIGRSGLFACCLLQELGASAGDAVAIVSRSRGEKVPETEAQQAFVHGWQSGIS